MLMSKLFCNMPAAMAKTASRNRSFKMVKKRLAAGETLGGTDDYAYNHIEKKGGLLKPIHTLEEQKEYMRSDMFAETYKNRPIHLQWKRNIKGQWRLQSPPRLFCIDRNGRFNVSHACPVCRDEYLFFDFRNPELLDHFLFPGTDRPLPIIQTGLCQEQYINLQAQLLKAKEHGTMSFNVPFRHFDYSEWYPEATDSSLVAKARTANEELPSRSLTTVEDTYPNPAVIFPTHNRDVGTKWDEWWLRQDKFVKRMK